MPSKKTQSTTQKSTTQKSTKDKLIINEYKAIKQQQKSAGHILASANAEMRAFEAKFGKLNL